MIRLRRLVQLLSLCLLGALFLATTVPLPAGTPVNLLFRFDVLQGLVIGLARGTWLGFFGPALVVLASTLLIGRFFCGWLCPTGALLDAVGPVVGSHRAPASRRLYGKYYLLSAALVAAVGGLTFAWMLDPAGTFMRLAIAVFPPFLLGWQALIAHHPFLMQWPLAPTAGVVFAGSLLVVALTAAIVALEKVEQRFWCRNLCPFGALLAMVGRFSMLRKVIGPSCNHCGLCQKACKTAAIHPRAEDFVPAECVYCFACQAACPHGAIRFRPAAPDLRGWLTSLRSFFSRRRPRDLDPVLRGMQRRTFLASLLAGGSYALLARTEASTKAPDARLIRPPSALPEEAFNGACIRCGECMKVCPTNGLQPSLLAAGLGGFWTPRLVPLIGYCEGPCDACGSVCPTGAIVPFKADDKKNIRLGHAVIDRDRCIAWRDDQKCLVCDEHCYYKAVTWKTVDGINRPFVEASKCTGCGICENKCPTRPDSAIVVYAGSDPAAQGPGSAPYGYP